MELKLRLISCEHYNETGCFGGYCSVKKGCIYNSKYQIKKGKIKICTINGIVDPTNIDLNLEKKLKPEQLETKIELSTRFAPLTK